MHATSLLQLLLGAQLVAVAALLLAAVDRAGVQASVAPAEQAGMNGVSILGTNIVNYSRKKPEMCRPEMAPGGESGRSGGKVKADKSVSGAPSSHETPGTTALSARVELWAPADNGGLIKCQSHAQAEGSTRPIIHS